ncbi:MAG: MFS transporter [Hyphomicrobiales bacterium]
METSAVKDTSDWRNVVAAIAAIAVFGFALGQMFPLLSLLLESRGYSDDVIGLNAAMTPAGILLSSAIIPPVARRFGARNVALCAAFASALLFLGYKVFPSLGAWFMLRLLHGIMISTLFVLSEVWIVRYASGHHRGKVVAIYASVLAGSFAAGPALIAWIGIEGWLPFLIGAAVLVAAMAPLSLVREDRRAIHGGEKQSLLRFAPKAPFLLLAVVVFATFDVSTLSLLPVYGIRIGLEVGVAASILTVLIAGNIFLQFPIGWLADALPKWQVSAGCSLVTALLCFAMPAVMGTPWMWPLLLVLGASGYGIYTVALSDLGDRFSGDELVQGSAAFATMWGGGALIGALIGGWAMAAFGPHALPILLGLTYFAMLAAIAVSRAVRGSG